MLHWRRIFEFAFRFWRIGRPCSHR